MGALLKSLAMKYGYDYAVKLLGIDKQTQNPKYAINLAGNTFDLGNMAKRVGLNQSMKAMTGNLSGMLGPGLLIGGALGLGYLTNPLREGSFNYNPNLAGQIADLNRRGMLNNRNQITSGPLAGKNLVSMFGTNDYGKMLDKKVDWFEDRITSGKDYSEKGYREAKNEAITEAGIGVNIDGVTMSGPDYQGGTTTGGTTGSKSSNKSSSRSSRHGSGAGGLHSYYRGGLASL
tara:strand:- start:59 stop:754 length:696 start_codon:yes stop_codon:yes gene_type:complete